VADGELRALAGQVALVRGFAAELRALELDDVPPWTPPS
jgi:hypothetical protein